ncbi:MAG: SUMF1/EgtB/PvdO family nonheme iron enzyme [Sedimenticola sp.]|nr:SUMF1/EgtB/PvdO family nonheme iron enzyme [Sedimenticola sp.]
MAVVPKQNGLDILRKLVPLNTLTEDTLAELMDAVEFEKVSKGDFLFREGDTNPERVYLLSGKIGLLEAGKEIDAVAAGTNMARYPVAHHIPRKYTVQAKTRAEVVRIGNRLLSDLLSRGGNALYQVEELNTDSEDDWMSQLLQSPIFQRIPAANIQNIMMRMEEMPVTAGEVVIRQGDEGDYFYLINRGQCAITKERDDGEITEIARLGPGDSVGEESLLSGQKRGSTVSMLTDGVLFRLGKKDFIEYIKLPLANAISYEAAQDKVAKGAIWLDVRSALEYERSHIPKSMNIPFNDLRAKVSGLDSSKPYVVYCQDGLVSSTAVYLLMERDLDGFVLERGLESVPDDVVNKEPTQDGAQIINLRPERDDAVIEPPDSKTAPSDEAGLLRERLQKTEAQAQEQLQRARKMKLMLDKLKGRLAEAEAVGEREQKEHQRLSHEVESLQNRLRERDEAHGALKQKQSAVNEQLGELKSERDHLQEELTKLGQQVGKLEKRLEASEQSEHALREGQAESERETKQALQALQAELDREKSAQAESAEQVRSLQLSLDEARAETEKLADELKQRESGIASLEQQQQTLSEEQKRNSAEQQQLQEQLKQAEVELEQARAEIAGLTEELKTKAQSVDALEAQQQTLTDSRTEIDRLTAELEAREKTVQQLQQDQQALDTLREELVAIGSARSSLEQEQTRLQGELDQARSEVAQLTADLENQAVERNTQVEDLERTLKEAQETTSRLQDEQSQWGESEQQLTTSLSTAEARIATLESELARVSEAENEQLDKLAVAEKQQLLLHSEIEQLRGELEGASTQIAQLESDRSEAEARYQQHHSELESSLKQSLFEAVEGRTQAESGLGAITEERDQLVAELAVLNRHHADLQRQMGEQGQDSPVSDQTDEALLASQAEQARLAQALEESAEAVADLQSAVKEKEQTLAKLQQDLETRDKDNEHITQQLQAAEQALEERQGLAESLEEIAREKQQAEAALSDGQQRITELEGQLAAAESQGQRGADELASLRAELEEMAEAKSAAEQAVARSKASVDSDAAASGDVKVLQAELATLNDALDEADHAYEQLNQEKQALQDELNRVQMQASGGNDETLLHEKEAKAQEVEKLTSELDALQTELALVREKSEADIVELKNTLDKLEQGVETPAKGGDDKALEMLRQELDETRLSLKEKELSSSADAAECEVLRQDIDKLKRSLDERSVELESARKESLLLEEKTEERNSEIDRLKLALEAAQVDADEAQFKRDEALESRKQVEEALYKIQKQVESERPRDDLIDQRISAASAGLDVGQGGGKKRALTGVMIGALLAFAGAEALSILAGKGELVSGFLDSGESVVVSRPSQPEVEAPEVTPQSVVETVSEKRPVVSPPVTKELVTKPAEPKVKIEPPAEVSTPAPLVKRVEPPVPVAPPKPREPETGSQIQDRLSSGGRGPLMLYVRGGTFTMGSRINHLASEELPAHEVTLPSYSISQNEVTFREYELFAAATDRRLPDDLGWGQGPRPVINVSWNDAKAYTEWLSEQTGKRYRLPTEAEWEYAAAAGTDSPYWWGFDVGEGKANCFNCGSQWDGVSTAPVGRFDSNPYGLNNTAGNVMEWVDDCYHNSYEGAPTDGSSWLESDCRERVIRGGAFNKPGESLRSTKRGRHDADAKLFVLGFRVARDIR